ncbi:MAG: NADPH-dependent FMN reductase, partial [Bacteroidia bacterium]|nr:NADPH-dependent FMN reductase [Bacteroidia bacterium]
PYANSHDTLDADKAVLAEVRNVAKAVAAAVKALRAGKLSQPGKGLVPPRPK